MVVDEIDLIIQKQKVGFICLISLIRRILSDLSLNWSFLSLIFMDQEGHKFPIKQKGKLYLMQSLKNRREERERELTKKREREGESSRNIRMIEIWAKRWGPLNNLVLFMWASCSRFIFLSVITFICFPFSLSIICFDLQINICERVKFHYYSRVVHYHNQFIFM